MLNSSRWLAKTMGTSLLPADVEKLKVDISTAVSTGIFFVFVCVRLHSTVCSSSDCRFRGHKFRSQLGHITFVETDHEIISVCSPLQLIEEWQLSVTDNDITKTRPFKYIEKFTSKNCKFSDKNSDIFHISA